jgi:flagellin
MSAVLNTNLASLWASRNLLNAQTNLANSVMRLSSGMRINSASDDAAGLGVASSLTSQINGADQGIRNLNDAISMVQTAEGALAATSEIGQRILTLATQGANGTLGDKERNAIQSEMAQLIISIDSISTRTNFSGNKLLDGTNSGGFSIQVSSSSDDAVYLNSSTNSGFSAFEDISSSGLASDMYSYIGDPGDGGNIDYQGLQDAAKTFIEDIDGQRSLLGAYQNQMSYTLNNVTELSTNLQAARSRVQDTDYAAETAKLTKGQILQQAATAMLAQANQMPNVILTLLK